MNQAIIFNDDLQFNKAHDAWSFTGQLSGQRITIYFHSMQLKQLTEINNCTKYDLEEVTELWLEKNEPEGDEIHIEMK
jgi:purine-nucleoside phosphorylase